MNRTTISTGVVLAAICTPMLHADAVTADPPSTRFTSSAFSLAPGAIATDASSAQDAVAPADAPPSTTPARAKFGAEGMLTFNAFADYANDFSSDSMAGVQLGISWFFVDDLSLDVQLEQYGFFQTGEDAYAIGPALLLRWHFLSYETWSLYADAGCGVIYASNPVPFDGSRFNFTPRAGIGASFAITESARLMAGVRWFHVSNANTSTPNPGLNSLEIYAGISIPF